MQRPFHPVRKVTDPSGYEWELYVSRGALPAWKDGYNSWLDEASPGDGPSVLLQIPFAIAGFLWSSILSPMLRFVVLLPFAMIKGRRSGAARIEAICFFPAHETRTWTTTLNQADGVVDEIALGIEQGKVVQPVGAVYSGTTEGSS